jgi:opacity protein-like surface antigen
MKTTRIIAFLIAITAWGISGSYAQTDSVRTSTTVTTTTTTGTATGTAEPAAAEAKEDDSDNDDYSKFYIGARFMPTFTQFDVKTLENGTAKTTFVVGYGIGGLIGVNFSRNVGMQLEAIYSSLSQKFTDRNEERRIDLTYIHIPLLLTLNTDVSKAVNLNIAFGPQVGINTGSEIESEGSNGVDTVQAVIAVKPADFGLAYGAGLDFMLAPSLTLDLGFRGVYGIIDISDDNKTKTTNQYYILDRSHVKTYAGYAGLKLLF